MVTGLMPWMTLKVAADQFEMIRSSVECVRGRMNVEESPTRAHKVEESCLFSAAHRKFSGCEEHHRGVARKFSVENSDVSFVTVTSKTPELLPICTSISLESGMTSCR